MASIASSEGDRTLDPAMQVGGAGVDVASSTPLQHRFSPYSWNGGTVLAVAGKDYCVVATDKRLAEGYSILSRKIDRALQLTDKTVIACGGSHNDVEALYNHLKLRAVMYKYNHEEDLSTIGAAQLLSNTLYYKRFFPYYALAVIAGLDDDGVGYVAGYDAVGSYLRSRDGYTANGSAAAIAMPILDNALGKVGVSSGLDEKPEYSIADTIEMLKDIFVTVGERDILCGDAVDIYAITATGTEHEVFELKAD
ncbi:Proteasome subunit beta type-1 [Hondaea fermentalgiana]|uniref:Proteasome subunit beta type-1 n=1 Tax=Hondaea fermentalgiana TaxID=2315210 RepID=A0A2R5GY14_9STRA|nr:Proteasome subunit beta type-1 [Hondaea fermentalgiana]|eukprot:GBG32864.1 Proteasome subunit beta type-1 [Hondaea fermentalgiana]